MCNFFSCWVLRDGRILFTEDDSYERTACRAGLRDDGTMDHYQRVECVSPFMVACVDERERASWLTDEMLDKVVALAQRIAPARKSWDEAVATANKAWNEAIAPARKAWNEAVATARKERDEAIAPARKAWNEAIATADKAWDEAVATARKAYIEFLSGIEGYVAE
jgi:virulence-associated protein VagC